MSDFLFRGTLAELDSDVHHLNQLEAERQYRKLILIPSESSAPVAVRESLSSTFQNLYAEGYPDEETRWMSETEILDFPARLAHYRRHSDPRYYKGVEYADAIEALARRRCAEAFATQAVTADQLYVNVQALSGAPANNAVYHLINPGDVVLGMNLLHGGHLTHGSSVNRSGKWYKIFHYNVNSSTEKIDYDAVRALAVECKPKMIIAGYSSYPWIPDWSLFRSIADEVGALFLADISHIAGLIAGGVVPSPVGLADVITFTTHKTLCGPRGACILTQDASLSKKIDKAVFPGEQGGPHVHVFAALATTFKLARTEQFKKLQAQIVSNCITLTGQLEKRGLRIPFGGTDSHLGNLDCKSITGPDGTPLNGDLAARVLDIAGIVLNRNTIPGDKSALHASGIRYGTPWMTQRGLVDKDMIKVADIMADVLKALKPYTIETRQGLATRAKIDFDVLEDARIKVREISEAAGIDGEPTKTGYPHFMYIDDKIHSGEKTSTFVLQGKNVRQFVHYAFASDVDALTAGQKQNSLINTPKGPIKVCLSLANSGEYKITLPTEHAGFVRLWLQDLSDGYIQFDDDITRRMPGSIAILETKGEPCELPAAHPEPGDKPFYIGIGSHQGKALPEFKWVEKEGNLKRTPLYETHVKLGAKIVPFAGWEMPVWYSSVMEEHLACRQAAGLFDVSHMGVYQVEGDDAVIFLDSVCGNDIDALDVGESCYTHFLDPYANVLDDTLVYRRARDKYLVVVNASNDDKDWAWLNGVLEGKYLLDPQRPSCKAFGRKAVLRNLRDPKEKKDMLVDIALQGPKSRDILLALGCKDENRHRIMGLKRTELCEARVGDFNLVISRTGYTGERMAFELFVHPEKAVALWDALMKAGAEFGLKPCGLGSRDSLRTESGLPLYGHEMGGEMNLGVAEAGFGGYVKTYKPWFVGREVYIDREKSRKSIVARFRFNEKGVRMAHLGDPVIDKKGRVIGTVTSCAIDIEGYLTGQALVEEKSALEGTPIFIYQGSPEQTGKSPSVLVAGDKVTLPTQATIVSRFPKPPKSN